MPRSLTGCHVKMQTSIFDEDFSKAFLEELRVELERRAKAKEPDDISMALVVDVCISAVHLCDMHSLVCMRRE